VAEAFGPPETPLKTRTIHIPPPLLCKLRSPGKDPPLPGDKLWTDLGSNPNIPCLGGAPKS